MASNAGPSSAGAAGGVKTNTPELRKASPWDPMTSQDWDKESHSKEALMRIKRWVLTHTDTVWLLNDLL